MGKESSALRQAFGYSAKCACLCRGSEGCRTLLIVCANQSLRQVEITGVYNPDALAALGGGPFSLVFIHDYIYSPFPPSHFEWKLSGPGQRCLTNVCVTGAYRTGMYTESIIYDPPWQTYATAVVTIGIDWILLQCPARTSHRGPHHVLHPAALTVYMSDAFHIQ